jgi:hypothetical protein
VTATSAPLNDLPAQYAAYLDRCAREIGDVKPGAFAKYAGQLIKKLSFEEFTQAHLEYTELLARYRDSLERGDTINDQVIKLIRQQTASLVLPRPRL